MTMHDIVSLPRFHGEPSAELLIRDIRKGFYRSLGRVTDVLDVSRQTFYNWANGATQPRHAHRVQLVEFAKAGRVFSETCFAPTSMMLTRPLIGGRSFLDLLKDEADGHEIAVKLMRAVEIATHQKTRLDKIADDCQGVYPDD